MIDENLFFLWISRRCSEYGEIKRKIYHPEVLNQKMYKIFQLSIIKFKNVSCENTKLLKIKIFEKTLTLRQVKCNYITHILTQRRNDFMLSHCRRPNTNRIVGNFPHFVLKWWVRWVWYAAIIDGYLRLYFGGGTGHWDIILWGLNPFPIFPNFPRS